MSSAGLKDEREAIKKYIDQADAELVRMVHAILQADAEEESDWWTSLPDEVRHLLNASIKEADAEKVMSRSELKKRHPQWFMK